MKRNRRIRLSSQQKTALQFIASMGLASLFADITYEGARSIIGAYLGLLGASAAMVGFIAGLGELIGYGFRLFSGLITDRTGRYWSIALLGYFINLLAVPLLALTHHWATAAILIILERLGKAIRVPSRDAMLSYAAKPLGTGLGFGIHQALDQLGAMLGPLFIAGVLYYTGNQRTGFALLGIPAVCALTVLLLLSYYFKQPDALETQDLSIKTHDFDQSFWIYLIGACFVGAGFADFALIAYHFQKTNVLSLTWIPIAYAMAMGVNSMMSLILGHLYDRLGFIVLIIVTMLAAFFGPLVFLGNSTLCILGVVLWAVGMGTQQSLMRAILGNIISKNKRGSAYGIFNMGYGVSWFLGSVLMGLIYDYSLIGLVLFIITLQFLSLPWFIVYYRAAFKKY